MRSVGRFTLILSLLISGFYLAGCDGDEASPVDSPDVTHFQSSQYGAPDYCVGSGQAHAEKIGDPNFRLKGRNAIGGEGDYLLANDRSNFVITGSGIQKTYYHYPGILVDAVAISDCKQNVDEEFYEMALMLGRLNPFVQSQSTFRAFNATNITVINDGSDGGAAIVRATGFDDYYWLLELTLMGDAILDAQPKQLSAPFGLQLEVDYILEPDSPTLKIEYRIINQLNSFNSISIAFALMSSGQGAPLKTFSAFDLKFSGLELQYGIPWVTASSGQAAYVFGSDSNVLTTTRIAGVDALLDARQLANSYLGTLLNGAGQAGDTLTQHYYVTVSQQGELDAVNNHLANTPSATEFSATPIFGRVFDSQTKAGIADANIEFQTKKQNFLVDWPWETFLTLQSDEQGGWGGEIPLIRYLSSQQYRVQVSAKGRLNPNPIEIHAAQSQFIETPLTAQGVIQYEIHDAEGAASPAQISIYQNGTLIRREYTVYGEGTIDVAPGDYKIVVSRGFEYLLQDLDLSVVANDSSSFSVTLMHAVDTAGFMSFDAHVHSAPSPDSEVSLAERLATAVATGLEVMVATDHEILTDFSPTVSTMQLQNHIATVVGQEVTASLPNHTIAYPLAYDSSQSRQFVDWYTKDIGEIFAAEKAMGAQIRTFAHPRSDYLNVIGWNRLTAQPGNGIDPRQLGLSQDARLWSWDFEAMELMNGEQKIFSSGIFADWMSFLNHGHRITATGASDIHDLDMPGMPRNYFRASVDSPIQFTVDQLVQAVQQGRVLVSTGAFATVLANGWAEPGDTVSKNDGLLNLHVHIQALPQIDVDHFRVYVNCDEVARISTQNPLNDVNKFDGNITIPIDTNSDSHVVLAGFGIKNLPLEFHQFDPGEVPRFVTNPVYVEGDGMTGFAGPGGKDCQF